MKNRTLPVNASSARHVLHGIGVHTALEADPDTADLAPRVWAAVDSLGRTRAQLGTAGEHLARRNAELGGKVESLAHFLEDVENWAEIQDKGQDGLCALLFPEGVYAVTRLGGSRLRKAVREILSRLESTTLHGGEALRSTCLQTLREKIAAFEASLETRNDAAKAFDDARQAVRRAKEALQVVFAQTRGALAERFPGNRRRQASYFPVVRSRRGRRRAQEPLASEEDEITEVDLDLELPASGATGDAIPAA